MSFADLTSANKTDLKEASIMSLLTNIATKALAQFETRTRDDGTSYVTHKRRAPEWVRDLCFAAHVHADGDGVKLPDDHRYEMIRDALTYISECGEDIEFPEDHADTFAGHFGIDGGVYEWLASHPARPVYCDTAAQEYSLHADTSIHDRVHLGYEYEMREVFRQVWTFLTNMIDEKDAA